MYVCMYVYIYIYIYIYMQGQNTVHINSRPPTISVWVEPLLINRAD